MRILRLSGWMAVVALLLVSCRTAPKPAEPEPEWGTGFTPIRSSQLFSARYFEDETLVVVRSDGTVYQYNGVPRAMADQFLAAEDKDEFYLAHLAGRFGETELKDEPEAATAPAAGEPVPAAP